LIVALHRADPLELRDAPSHVVFGVATGLALIGAQKRRLGGRHRCLEPVEPPVVHARQQDQQESRDGDQRAQRDRGPAQRRRAALLQRPGAGAHAQGGGDTGHERAERHDDRGASR